MLKQMANDLKADYKKTAAMCVLAVVLLVLVVIRISETGEDDLPVRLTANRGSMASPGSPLVDEKADGGRLSALPIDFPPILTAALAFDEINNNPFELFYAKDAMSSFPEGDDQNEAGKGGAPAEKEGSLDGIDVSCTVKGDGEEFAIVNGKILKKGDTFKGFELKEIGERYVIFASKTSDRSETIEF